MAIISGVGSVLGCVSLLLQLGNVAGVENEIQPSCAPSEPICRVQFTLTQVETMILYEGGRGIPIVYQDGVFKKRLTCFQYEDATPEELSQVNMGDGLYKFVYGVNNEVPGPTIVIYENQTLEVTVTNLLMHEGGGIHWHGIFQVGTPFMDGVPSVTQCPINPMETFVYRFQPKPQGTHFYHSHMGVQRTDGVYGGLIVLPQDEDTSLPEFEKEFLVLFHDWFPHTNIQDLYAYQHGLSEYTMYGYNSSECQSTEPSTLVNGKGYRYAEGEPVVPVPLTTYTVQEGSFYRFRLINSALETAYKVHIDQHTLTVISSDGSSLTPVEADYVILHTGERYDVYIEANQPVDNYWIRVEFVNYPDQPGLAVLRYEGADEVLPTSSHTQCTEEDHCKVVNCPFEYFDNTGQHFDCINMGNLTSTGAHNYFEIPQHSETDALETYQELEEHFMIFQFSVDAYGTSRAAVNGIHFLPPSSPPQIHRTVNFDHHCNNYDCASEPCRCTNMEAVTIGNTVQMVFAAGEGLHGHPIHLHGHRFQVLKVAYGLGFGVHPDITCVLDGARCTDATWTDPSWSGGNIPGMNVENPPEKDTVIVPRGGYVVVRYYANNTGWWMLHCHMDFHFASGMGIIIQEGREEDMPVPPNGMAMCGSFNFDAGFPTLDSKSAEGGDVLAVPESRHADTELSGVHIQLESQHTVTDSHSSSAIAYVLCFLGGFILALCLAYIAAVCTRKTAVTAPQEHVKY